MTRCVRRLVGLGGGGECLCVYVCVVVTHTRTTLTSKPNTPQKKQAHPPIHPTKLLHPDQIKDERERKIYELVVRHFLACCSDDARGQRTTVCVEMGGESFKATGACGLWVLWWAG